MPRIFADINCDTVARGVPIIAVYNNPSDYPGKYVARLWNVEKIGKLTQVAVVKDTLEEIREQIPYGLINVGRSFDDDPVIEEVWI